MKEQKDLDFKFIKAPDDAGTFLGYASVFGVVDSYNDIVQPGAFKKALKERAYFPLLWSHSINEPIGIVTGRNVAAAIPSNAGGAWRSMLRSRIG